MKWLKRAGSLTKRLETVKNPGKRLKLIRETRNNTSEFRGQSGMCQLAEHLAEAGCIPDGPAGRKLVKGMEIGARTTIPASILEPWLKFLDTTAEEAGVSVMEESPLEPAAEVKATKPAQALANTIPTDKVVFINHCEGLNFEFFTEQYQIDGSIHVHIFHDEPVPEAMQKDFRRGVRMKRVWVPGAFTRYENSSNPDDREAVTPRKTADLSK